MVSQSQPHSPSPSASQAAAGAVRTRLGRGRSGIVYAEPGADGYELACKVFLPDRASTLVMTVLTGAPNPYRWSRAAVEAAVCRRRILERLVGVWFGDRLRLPRTAGWAWNPEHRAHELHAERIHGRHALLRHPGCEGHPDEARELARTILHPLQAHLAEAGLDGLLWQAGLGNPVAMANFMREETPAGGHRWVWIDMESGVPALFPFNLWRLVSHYLPLSHKHGRWLFDDVDVSALEAYCQARQADLVAVLGPRGWNQLCQDVRALDAHQRRWRSLGRTQRSVAAHLATGKIDREQARHYWQRPVAWMGRMARRVLAKVPRKAAAAARSLGALLTPRALAVTLGRWGRFFSSQRVRERWAARHVRRRILDWRQRGFMSRESAQAIRASMQGNDAAEYLADFGVCLAIKPFMKALQWGLVPLLYALGVIESGWLTAFLVLAGGALGRTVYTLGRCVQSAVRGRPIPWVALLAGLAPVAGNAAYPLQLLWSTSGEQGLVARFLLHDIGAAVGRHVPIWGGGDTRAEHLANDSARLFLRLRRAR